MTDSRGATAVEGAKGQPEDASESIKPRALVPTARQMQEGIEAERYEFADLDQEDQPDLTPSQAIMKFVHDIDPRLIEGPKLPIIVFAAGALIGGWDDKAFEILAPEIRTEFGLSLTFVFSMLFQVLILTSLLGPPMGWLADRVSRVWMVRIGAITTNVMSIAGGVSQSVPQLWGSRIGNGLARSVSDPAVFPLITDYYPTRTRARLFSFFFAAGALGGVLGPTVAGRLADSFGWRGALITLGALATFVSFGTFFLREPKRGVMDRLDMGASEEVAQQEQEPVSFAEGWRAARSISTVRKIWYASPFLFVGGVGASVLVQFYWAEVFFLGPAGRGYLGTLGGIVGLFGLMFSGPVTDRLLADRPGRLLTYMGIVTVAQAISIVILSFSPWFLLSVGISIPTGFVSALLLPAQITIISMVIPPRLRGFGIQSINWFQLLGIFVVMQLIFAAVADIRVGMRVFAPFIALGGFIVMSAAGGIARDIRAARAAAMADEAAAAARREGRNKMLICRDVDVTYDGGVQVLFNVDLDVEEGEMIALLGTNGAGKSTLLRAIAGIQEASNGAIFLDGRDITHAPSYESAEYGVVMMPGGHAVFPNLTVGENLEAATWLYRNDEALSQERIDQVLEFFPVLRDRWQQPAGSLSGGEQQMVGLGQAFLMNPRLLMIDELTLGLAPTVVEQLLEILRAINAEGTTIMIVEQSINVALTVADRAIFMEKGEVQFDGPTSELLARPELVRSVFMGGAAVGGRSAASRRSFDQNTKSVLEVRDVVVTYGGIRALDGASVDVKPGEIVGIIGPNGAGKTTLFDAVSGFAIQNQGKILIEGADVTGAAPDIRSRLGLGRSFQRAELFAGLTVRENVAIALERKANRNPLLAATWAPPVRKSEEALFRRVDGLIELLGLEAFRDKFVGELSTGSRRAVDVACIMAQEPKILLLDEPSSGLAQAETEELGPVITRLVRDTGCGVLIIEHDLPLITSISDRLVAMELGRVVAEGTPEEVTSDPRVLESYLSADAKVISRSDSTSAALAAALTGKTTD